MGELEKTIASITALNDLAWQYLQNNPAQSLQFSKEAEQLSLKLNYRKGLAYSLCYEGIAMQSLANFEKSLRSSMKALHLFEQLGDDFGKALALNNIGNTYYNTGKYQRARLRFQQSLLLRQDIHDVCGQAASLNNIGMVFQQLGDCAQALAHYNQSLILREQSQDTYGTITSLNNIGAVFQMLGENTKALEHFLKALRLIDEIEDISLEATALHNIGAIYYSLGDYSHAQDYYEKSLGKKVQVSDVKGQADVLNNLSHVFYEQGNFTAGEDALLKSVALKKQAGDQNGASVALKDLAMHHIARQEFEIAENYLIQSLQLLRETQDALGLAQTLKALGELCAERCHLPQAIEYFEQAMNKFVALDAKTEIPTTAEALAKVYESTGDFKSALDYFKRYQNSRTEASGAEIEKKIKTLMIQFDVEKAQRETEIFRTTNQQLAQTNHALEQALKEAELQRKHAIEANSFKTELLSIAAHDLRSPLQSISGFTMLIKEELSRLSDERVQTQHQHVINMTEIIGNTAGRMLDLINELLQSTAIESGKIQCHPQQVNLCKIAKTSAASFDALALFKHQQLICHNSAECFVYVDPVQLRGIIDNLISNAIKYSPQDTQIHIRSERQADKVFFSVKDEGQGLSKQDMEKVFQQFQRLSSRPTANETSFGLGLAIAKQLAQLNSGKIYVQSEGKGKGSIFTVEFKACNALASLD